MIKFGKNSAEKPELLKAFAVSDLNIKRKRDRRSVRCFSSLNIG